ncbi:MAG: toll/interleukin-1 receptor domain-containing protein, partial [Bacteroidales bacterium]|nr:toll/interleukin-1 receptor domain-containing protein [Bacteroidales bacterium]
KPVFFAPTDIQPGGLSSELQERLKASRNLIVICSPNSAKSEWVGREIEFFHKLGRTNDIHFFIVEGEPHSSNPDNECFNPVVDTLGLPEILGANIHEKNYKWSWLNKERAYVQLVSKLLGVEFDALWKRHKRLLIRKAITWALGIIAVIAALIGIWVVNQPVDVKVSLNETSVHNAELPTMPDNITKAVVSITLDNETKADTLDVITADAMFNNIPHRYIGKKVKVNFSLIYSSGDDESGYQSGKMQGVYYDVDTTVILSRNVTIDIRRNPDYYGNVHFTLWDVAAERGVPNTTVKVGDYEAVSDANGEVRLSIPLEDQRPDYKLSAAVPLQDDAITMPCFEDKAVLVR